jgi:hypothetical protein
LGELSRQKGGAENGFGERIERMREDFVGERRNEEGSLKILIPLSQQLYCDLLLSQVKRTWRRVPFVAYIVAYGCRKRHPLSEIASFAILERRTEG